MPRLPGAVNVFNHVYSQQVKPHKQSDFVLITHPLARAGEKTDLLGATPDAADIEARELMEAKFRVAKESAVHIRLHKVARKYGWANFCQVRRTPPRLSYGRAGVRGCVGVGAAL
jgi:hypothetical protein